MERTKELLRKVRRIEIKTRKLVDGLLQGAYHSAFKGRGIEFSEVREYLPGDDVRNIDWKVTSRMNKPFVKDFIEERDLTVLIAFDVSGSNEFGHTKSKREAATELAASLMFAALKNNDRIGMVLFTDKIELFMKPRKGRKHVLQMISRLVQFKPESRGTDVGNAFRFVSKAAKRSDVVFVISDFASGDFSKELSVLKNRHDVIAINIGDMREEELPDVGYIHLEDEETGEQLLVNTSDRAFRSSYARLVCERNAALSKLFKRLKVDVIPIKNGEPFEIPLRKFFRERCARMVR